MMKGSAGRWLASAWLIILMSASTVKGEEDWPTGLSFVGFTNDRWQVYIVPPGASQPQTVATASEPRTPTYNAQAGKVAYIDAGGHLREMALATGSDRVLLKPDHKQAFTQPAYDSQGDTLFVVVLKNGTSVDTDIIVLSNGKRRTVVKQRSAQFEPFFQNPHTLYYSNVLCTLGCGKIIQETWRINLITEQAEQLTLVNAIARQPVVSSDGRWLYFSSDRDGHFHIWRLALDEGHYQRLTEGYVTDISPALDDADNLYFIRQSPAGTQLMRLGTNGTPRALILPDAVDDLRDLEINR